MPAELHRMVDALLAEGKSENEAWAIATAKHQKMSGKKKGKKRKKGKRKN